MNKTILFVLIISILPVLSLVTPGLPITHDGQDHIARVANFYQSLSEGNLVPRWGNNLNWGFGHPVLMFLYPLPSYAASVFHFFGFSFVDSVKLVFAFTYILSILAMYLYAKDEWGEIAGIAAALIYGFSPYRFVNLYVRGAYGEHAAFVFLPLILWGISGIAKKQSILKWQLLNALSLAGLFLSHNAVSIMMIPLLGIYALYLSYYKVQPSKRVTFIINLFLSVLYAVGLSAFFLIPAFLEGKYTLRDIVTQGEISGRMVQPLSFILSGWNYGGGNEFSKNLGLPAISSLFIAFYIVIKGVKKHLLLSLFILLLFLYLFLMTPPSLFIWNAVSLLQKFQFPWRFLVMSSLMSALIGGLTVSLISAKYKNTFVIILTILVLSTYFMWKPKAYKNFDEKFFTDVYNGTTDTGESSPIWSVRFMEFSPELPLETAEGKTSVDIGFRNTTSREYTVTALERSKIVENTLYFPGWKIYVDGQETPIEFQDPQWRGRMTFWINIGRHTIKVLFTETKLRKISDIISVTSFVVLLPLIYLAFNKKEVN